MTSAPGGAATAAPTNVPPPPAPPPLAPPPPPSSPPGTFFANKPNLQTTADLWCSNETAALAEYGNISDWDVSRITDMNMHSWIKQTPDLGFP